MMSDIIDRCRVCGDSMAVHERTVYDPKPADLKPVSSVRSERDANANAG